MNKKIFTLLTGTFLMFATVFTVVALTPLSYIDYQTLGLGNPVQRLKLGANDGYYHLNVVAVGVGAGQTHEVAGTGGNPTDYVLYMGKEAADGTYPLFIDGLSQLHNPANKPYFTTGGGSANVPEAKADRSASSLWCTVVNEYNQGKNIIFDFINKQQKDVALEVDIDGYELWGTDGVNPPQYQVTESPNPPAPYLTPGSVSGWEFSSLYATNVQTVRPLVSYLNSTRDTVAVLCIDYDFTSSTGFWNNIPFCNVVVKIASADDLANRRIRGVLYFTLREALPFTLSAYDFNTMLGSDIDDIGQLKFNPDVRPTTGTTENLFTRELMAEDITADRLVVLNIEDIGVGNTGDYFIYHQEIDITASPMAGAVSYNSSGGLLTPTPSHYNITGGFGSDLTSLGYILLKDPSVLNNNYLYAQYDYYIDRPSGTRFLNFGERGLGTGVNAARVSGAIDWGTTFTNFTGSTTANWNDALLFNQSVWRLVYYPSGDSIYINPYQATYLPLDYENVPTLEPMKNPDTNLRLEWTDMYAQASNNFTYRAYPYYEGDGSGADHDYLALDPVSIFPYGMALTKFEGVTETTDPFTRMVARLKFGKNPARNANNTTGLYEYTFYHKLYVTLVDLTGSARAVTLRNGNATNNGINTQINFGIYEPCSYVSTTRTTLVPDLYLIRNERGEYLHVPLYSATDSAVWVYLEKDVHPEFLPSFQWVVQRKYPNSDVSPIILINREFDQLVYEDILLTKGQRGPFVFRVPNNFPWNRPEPAGLPAYNVNELVVDFGSHNTSANQLKTFIKLGKQYKNNEQMGYTYIDHNISFVHTYAFKYLSGISQRYISANDYEWYWKYPATDTTVYVKAQTSSYNKLNFRVDTVDALVGAYKAYGYNPNSYANNIADLVQLKRQAYQMWVDDPYLLICDKDWGLMNGIQSEYTIGKNITGYYRQFLGRPAFYLRHYYHVDGKYEQPGFALVQKIDPTTYMNYTTQTTAFLAYITEIYGPAFSAIVRDQIIKQQESSLDLGFFVASVDDQTAKLKATLRADAATRVSTFQLAPDEDPIYRRFDKDFDHPDGIRTDAPKTLEFYWTDNRSYRLFENTGLFPDQKNYWENYGIGTWNTPGRKNYAGFVNISQHPTATTAIYVDTAYINRGTGHIKPQYLLVVDTTRFEGGLACDDYGVPNIVVEPYLRGRYLINATDSAKNSLGEIVNKDYIWDTKWERAVFTDAIHARDHLYILSGVDVMGSAYTTKLADGRYVLDLNKLDIEAAKANTRIRKVYLGDNMHKDVVWQMRLIERGSVEFLLESETGTNQTSVINNRIFHYQPASTSPYSYVNSNGPMIKPCVGGWLKTQNYVPVISRSDIIENIWNSGRWNTYNTKEMLDHGRPNIKPVANDEVAVPTVIGNDGFVTILNASGKKVVITNILGQTVASAIMSSDNAAIAAPKGVVIVAIEGEPAVKAMVK